MLLGAQCRMQLVWSVHAATLRCNQAAISSFSSSEVVALSGIDAWVIRWFLASAFYLVSVPIEIAFLVYLSCTQVGVAPAFVSMASLAGFMMLKLGFVKVASVKQTAARTILSERFAILSEAISSNSVVKLMGTLDSVLETLGVMRKREERKMVWQTLSNTISLTGQCSLAPLMAWASSELRCCVCRCVSSYSCGIIKKCSLSLIVIICSDGPCQMEPNLLIQCHYDGTRLLQDYHEFRYVQDPAGDPELFNGSSVGRQIYGFFCCP